LEAKVIKSNMRSLKRVRFVVGAVIGLALTVAAAATPIIALGWKPR
jgi:hypothetical protein